LGHAAESRPETESVDKEDTEAEDELIKALRRQRGFTHAAVTAVLRARGLLRLTIAATLTALGGGDELVSWLYSQLVEEKLRSLPFSERTGYFESSCTESRIGIADTHATSCRNPSGHYKYTQL